MRIPGVLAVLALLVCASPSPGQGEVFAQLKRFRERATQIEEGYRSADARNRQAIVDAEAALRVERAKPEPDPQVLTSLRAELARRDRRTTELILKQDELLGALRAEREAFFREHAAQIPSTTDRVEEVRRAMERQPTPGQPVQPGPTAHSRGLTGALGWDDPPAEGSQPVAEATDLAQLPAGLQRVFADPRVTGEAGEQRVARARQALDAMGPADRADVDYALSSRAGEVSAQATLIRALAAGSDPEAVLWLSEQFAGRPQPWIQSLMFPGTFVPHLSSAGVGFPQLQEDANRLAEDPVAGYRMLTGL